jgi:hypothetical protein
MAGKPPLNEVKAEIAEAARLTSIYESMQRGVNVTPQTTLAEVLNAHVKALRAIQAALDWP